VIDYPKRMKTHKQTQTAITCLAALSCWIVFCSRTLTPHLNLHKKKT